MLLPSSNNAACPLCTMRSPELSRSILSCLAFAHNSADDLRCFSPPIPVTLRSRPHSTRSPSTFSLSPLRELATALPSLFSVPSVDGQILAWLSCCFPVDSVLTDNYPDASLPACAARPLNDSLAVPSRPFESERVSAGHLRKVRNDMTTDRQRVGVAFY